MPDTCCRSRKGSPRYCSAWETRLARPPNRQGRDEWRRRTPRSNDRTQGVPGSGAVCRLPSTPPYAIECRSAPSASTARRRSATPRSRSVHRKTPAQLAPDVAVKDRLEPTTAWRWPTRRAANATSAGLAAAMPGGTFRLDPDSQTAGRLTGKASQPTGRTPGWMERWLPPSWSCCARISPRIRRTG